ncbi:MAG: glycosyltransferase family 1 protein [Chloroflexi bacterium]|nr:glycosyltransferase family 1 protein [Chloroflexota bacterium]
MSKEKIVTIMTNGSRGQVQPYVALGKQLQAEGIPVRLATASSYQPFVTQHGLDFHKITDVDVESIAQTDEAKALMATKNPLKMLRGVFNLLRPYFDESLDGMMAALDGASIGIVNPLTQYGGYDACEKLSIIPIFSYVQSVIPMKELPSAFMPSIPAIPGQTIYNRLSHQITTQIIWQLFRPLVNDARVNRLGLDKIPLSGHWPMLKQQKIPILMGFSPQIIPPSVDWGAQIHVPGFWYLDEPDDWSPSPDLAAFLADGEPPIFVGFGSVTNRDPKKTTQIMVDALVQSGERGLLLTGWGGHDDVALPDNIFKVTSCPFSWLFPRMKAIVHHGGAGTTADAFRAGKPQIVIPHFSDQPFWGRMTHQLGVGVKPLSNKTVSAESLASAIKQVAHSDGMQQKAAKLGQKIRTEDGVGKAVEIIKRMLIK